jgi:hypothetical protein
MHHHPQTRPITIQATLFRVIICVWFVASIVARHVAFATRISAALIFMHALSVMTSIAAAVLTTTALTVTGPISILLPN